MVVIQYTDVEAHSLLELLGIDCGLLGEVRSPFELSMPVSSLSDFTKGIYLCCRYLHAVRVLSLAMSSPWPCRRLSTVVSMSFHSCVDNHLIVMSTPPHWQKVDLCLIALHVLIAVQDCHPCKFTASGVIPLFCQHIFIHTQGGWTQVSRYCS
jgi:hypothetical protein